MEGRAESMKLTNKWNRFIYRLWAPVYDVTVNRAFRPGRKRTLEVLALQPGERVLIAGIGTGEDLLLLPAGVQAVGIDISPEMLSKARGKLRRWWLGGRWRRTVTCRGGDPPQHRDEPSHGTILPWTLRQR